MTEPPTFPANSTAFRLASAGSTSRRVLVSWDTRWPWGLGALIGCAGVAISAMPVWGSWTAPGADGPFHVLRASQADALISSGQLDGWMPSFFAGHQAFLFNAGGFPWLASLLHRLSGGHLSVEASVTLIAVGSLALFPLTVAFLGRSFGLSGRAAGAAGALVVLISYRGGLGPIGVFRWGLLTHQVGGLLWAITLGSLLRCVQSTGSRWVYVASILAATTVLVSPVTAEILVVHAVLVLPLWWYQDPNRAAVARLAKAAGLTVGLSALWWLPAWVHRDLAGMKTGWTVEPLPERLLDLLQGEVAARSPLAAAATVAAVVFVVSSGRRPFWVASMVIPPVGYLLVAQTATQSNKYSLITHQLIDRGLAHTLVLACLPLAVLIGAGIDHASRSSPTIGRLLALSMIAVIPLQGPLLHVADENVPRPTTELLNVQAFLESSMSSRHRFGFEHSDSRARDVTGVTSPGIWLAKESGLRIVNGLGFEVTTVQRGSWLMDRLSSVDPGEIAEGLQRLGVSHVVTLNPASAGNLVTSERWRMEANFGSLTVWRILAEENTTLRIWASRVTDAGQRQVFLIEADSPDGLVLPVAFSIGSLTWILPRVVRLSPRLRRGTTALRDHDHPTNSDNVPSRPNNPASTDHSAFADDRFPPEAIVTEEQIPNALHNTGNTPTIMASKTAGARNSG